MSFGHAWVMERPCSDEAWGAARLAARLAFESLGDRAGWGPLRSGFSPPWEGGEKPAAQSLGVWLMLNDPPARAGLDGALESELCIEALPGADDWMAYPARLDRAAKSGVMSTGNKLHDLVALAALCAIEASDPGAVWIRHTDGDEEHWSAALSWLSRQPKMPRLFIPRGAPGHRAFAALAAKESEEISSVVGEGKGRESGAAGRSGKSRARKA